MYFRRTEISSSPSNHSGIHVHRTMYYIYSATVTSTSTIIINSIKNSVFAPFQWFIRMWVFFCWACVCECNVLHTLDLCNIIEYDSVVKLACGQRWQPILNEYEYEKWCHWNQISHFMWKRERKRVGRRKGRQKSCEEQQVGKHASERVSEWASEQASMEQDTIW